MAIGSTGYMTSRDEPGQSRTSVSGHRTAVSRVVRRDRILFSGALPSTQLPQRTSAPAAAPLLGDRGHGPTVAAAHDRRERSDVWNRVLAARGNAADECFAETFCGAITTGVAPHC
jgi:hypothetical protein